MAFRDFSFPEVQQALGLQLAEADLYGGVRSGAHLTLDVEEYFIAEPGRIMGILAHVLKAA